MPSDITIPPAALEAGKRCICLNGCGPDVQCDYCTKTARATFLAMLAAWPGMRTIAGEAWPAELILPIPQEKPDDKA